MHGLRNFVYNVLAAYQEYLVGLVVALLIARSLGPEVFGIYSMIMWIVAVSVQISSGGAGIAIMRYLPAYRNEGRHSEIASLVSKGRNVVIGMLPISLVASLSSLVFLATLDHLELDTGWYLVVAIAVIARSLSLYLMNTARGFEEIDRVYRVNLFVNPLNLALVALVWYAYANLDGYLYVYAVVSILYLFFSHRFIASRSPAPFAGGAAPLAEAETRRVYRNIASLSLLSIVSFIVERQIEVLFLNFYALNREAGIYNAAFMLASAAVTLIPGVLSGVFLPIIAKSSGRSIADQIDKFRELSRYTFLLTAPLVAFGIAFSHEIVVFVFGDAYAESDWPFAIIVVGLGLGKLCDAANSVLIGGEKQLLMTKLIAAFAVLNVVLDYVLIGRFGLNGALAALLVKQLGLSMALIVTASRTLGATLEYGSYLKILSVALVATLPALGLSATFDGHFMAPVLSVVYALSFAALLLVFRQLREQELRLLRSVATLKFRAGTSA